MSNTPARPCTTTALLWQNSLSWISTPSATCLSTVAPSACGLQPLVGTVVPGGSRLQALWAKRMSRGRSARSTPPSRCSAIAGACSSSATSSSETAATSESCRPTHIEGIASNILADRLKRLVGVGTAHPRGHATRPAGALQPDRTRDPARTRVRAARQLGTSPPAHEPARCAFAPSCSNKAAPRSGRSSWTSFATRTLAPNPQRDHRAFASA